MTMKYSRATWLALLCTALASTSASSYDGEATTHTQERIRQLAQARIIGGTEVTDNRYSFFAYLERGCGGALVEKDLIVTAAHCYHSKPSESNEVTIDGVVRNYTAVGQHPYFYPEVMHNDIMILKLNKPVEGVEPVTLSDQNFSYPGEGKLLTVLGVGATMPDATDANATIPLQQANVFVVSESSCLNAYGEQFAGNETAICAANAEASVSLCPRDSGGPLLDENSQLVGIASMGIHCGKQETPGVYTRITGQNLKQWIRDQICLMTDYPPAYCDSNQATTSFTVELARPQNWTYPPELVDSVLNFEDYTGIHLRLDVVYDAYGVENSWELRNTDEDEVIDRVDYYTVKEVGLVSKLYTNLAPGHYSFVLQDYANDGICCDFGKGTVRIYSAGDNTTTTLDDVLLWELPSNFTSLAEYDFVLEEPEDDGITTDEDYLEEDVTTSVNKAPP